MIDEHVSQTRIKNALLLYFTEYLRKLEGVRATNITATTVTVSWSKPANLTYVEYYEIILNTGDVSQTYKTSNDETIDHKTIEKLSPGVVYYCRVRALIRVNGNDHEGDWSNQIHFTTLLRKVLFVGFYHKKSEISQISHLVTFFPFISNNQISPQSL